MKSIKTLAASLILAAIALSAQAADFVTNSPGTVIYGAADAQIIAKDTSAGYNRVAVKYPGGYQYATDDAGWTVYAKLVSKLGANGVAVPGSPTGTVVNFAKVINAVCQQSSTLVSFPGGQPDNLQDGCLTFNAAKGASQ